MSKLVRTPAADAEVRRNLIFSIGGTALGFLLFVTLLIMVVGVPGSSFAVKLGGLILLALALPVLLMTGVCLTLAYLLDCWPGFMRARVLGTLYGINPNDLSNPGMRQRMKSPGFWLAFARGAGVAFVFVAPWFFGTWMLHKERFPEGYLFPSLMMIGVAGGVSAKSWVVRQLVAGIPQPPPA